MDQFVDSLLGNQNSHFRFYISMYIKQRRKSLKLTQEQVSLNSMIPLSRYRKIENGKAKLTTENFEKLYSVLEFSNSDLYEISAIANIAYTNELAKNLTPEFPQ